MKRILLLLFLSILCFKNFQAQEIVTGKVVDGKNVPVPGVRVEVVGSYESTVTDIDGSFRIELQDSAQTLRFTYVSYKPIERKVSSDMIVKLGKGWLKKESGYRGFVDLSGGIGGGKTLNIEKGNAGILDFGKTTMLMGGNTTHGYQINSNFFVGLGIGVYGTLVYHRLLSEDTSGYATNGVTALGYFDFRYDYDITSKASPFADIKLGVVGNSIFLNNDNEHNDEYSHQGIGNIISLHGEYAQGFLVMPSVGYRLSLENKLALNLSISYIVSLKRKYSSYLYPASNGSDFLQHKNVTLSGGVALLNIGVDF